MRQSRVVANFDAGSRIRWAIIAATRFRSRHGRDASSESIPNFFIKLATIAAGALHYPVWRFFIFCWAGKTLKSLAFAAVGYAFSDWLINLFEGTL